MKRFVFSLCLLFSLFTVASAQQASEHMTFKGIPINGTLNSFVNKLKLKGYNYIDTDNGIALLSGDFASYKRCTIGVVSSKEKDLVIKVAVIFPSYNCWAPIENNYLTLKEMLTKKYGEPSECIETFQAHSQPDDDNTKMGYLGLNQCKYLTVFETKNGTIVLELANKGYTEGNVILSYYDAENQKTVMSDAMDDL